MSNANNVFVLSHSSAGYDFGDGIKQIVKNPETLNYIKSYVDSITGYASDTNYMSASFVSKSYFVKDNYAVFVEAYPKRDNRLFLEIKLTVEDISASLDIFTEKGRDTEGLSAIPSQTATFIANAMLMACVAEKTKLYCLVNNSDEKIIDALNSLLFKLPPKVLCKANCIDVIGKFPEIKTYSAICRVITPSDKAYFENEIKGSSNCVIIDFTGEKPFIKFNVSRPTYAQTVIWGLMQNKISAFNNFRTTLSKFGAIETDNKSVHFNAVAYEMLMSNAKFAPFVPEFPATAEEIEAIKEYLSTRGDK